MCGRYFIDDEMWREIRKICKQIDDAKLKVTVGDVRPTDMAMVLTGMKNVHLEAMRWGFTSKYQDWLLINARAESILSKPAFRNSVRNCRCVIPAAGFYEWNKEKEKISFTMPQSDILYMAGVWQPTEKESQFTIITTVPNSSVSSVHDRMPLGTDTRGNTAMDPGLEHGRKTSDEDTSAFGAEAGIRAVVYI